MKITFLVIWAEGEYRVCQSNDCSKAQRKSAVSEYSCNLAASRRADALNAGRKTI